jgi:CubicO group peptidase (beta-lactamase class C family)
LVSIATENDMLRDLGPAKPEDVGLSSEGIAHVDAGVQRLIDKGVLAGAVTLVARHGRIVHTHAMGLKDKESREPLATDTMFRIFSMTKPVTGTAMMILHDEGRWSPDDPIAKHLPEFAGVKVFAGFDANGRPRTEDAGHAPTLRELLTHTAGFSYGFDPANPVDKLYQAAKVWGASSLDEMSKRIASLPLAYQPGSKWLYSLSMDIQGALIERLSGQALPQFMHDRIFAPLGMTDTAFHTPPEKRHRLATLYRSSKSRGLASVANPLMRDHDRAPALASGGGGLISTAADYARFAQMLLNGGELGGARIISPEATKLQMSNHLPQEMLAAGFGVGHQQIRPGFGYGFDGAVFTDPALAGIPVGEGTYQWDGAAGTWFWVDPKNDVVYVGMIQLLSEASPPLQSNTQTWMAEAIIG